MWKVIGSFLDLVGAGMLLPYPMTPRQREADRILRRIRKSRKEIDELWRRAYQAGACCPSCYSGGYYGNLVDAHHRKLQACAIQLKKNALPEHEREFRAALFDSGFSSVEMLLQRGTRF